VIGLRLFASAREEAGTGSDRYDLPDGTTLGALLEAAVGRYGVGFDRVLAVSRVWVNGEEPPAGPATPLTRGDEVAILPPVSGGA